MVKSKLDELKKWFENHVQSHKSEDENINKNLKLKQKHTQRVCQEIINIGKKLNLKNEQLVLAETMALFHDVGRFEQYIKYGTFFDMKSENHAELGVKILKKFQVLKSLDEQEQDLILKTISFHNRKFLPEDESSTCLFYSKLLRDADKLDIWEVVTDYYKSKECEPNEAIELGLPDTPEFSEQACNNLNAEKIVELEQIKNFNDFKLLQIGWVYDVNFIPALSCVCERRYLQTIREYLPESETIDHVLKNALLYIDRRINGQCKSGKMDYDMQTLY